MIRRLLNLFTRKVIVRDDRLHSRALRLHNRDAAKAANYVRIHTILSGGRKC